MKDDPFWRRYWRSLRFGREVADELQFHVDLLTKDLIHGGMDPAVAAREAARRFGDRQRVQADLETIERRRGRRLNLGFFLSELWGDIRYGTRGLLKRPGFTITAALSLGLGIGTATVVLTMVDNWLLRPMAVPDAEELVVMAATSKALESIPIASIPVPAITDIAARTDLFQSVGGWYIQTAGLRIGDGKTGLSFLLATSGNYFDLIRATPALGRTYSAADDQERSRVLVLNDQTWRKRFGADPRIVGRTVTLSGLPFTVIGVLPATFRGTEPLLEIDGFVPFGAQATASPEALTSMTSWRDGRTQIIARKRPDRTIGQIRAAMDVMSATLGTAHPELPEAFHIVAYPESRARPSISAAGVFPVVAVILTALGLLVLATAAANVANLLLARASTRSTELSVRLALGASRRRVIQQLLTESALLGGVGLAIAWAFATTVVRTMSGMSTGEGGPVSLHLAADGRILAMAGILALGAGLLSGVGPALLASRGQLHDSLRRAGRSGLSGRGRVFRATLVVGQVAVALVVLVCAGLFVQSARHASDVDLGFDAGRILTATIEAEHSRYTKETAAPILDRLVRRVREMPGVVSADWSADLPLSSSGGGTFAEVFLGTGDGRENRRGARTVFSESVGPDYFKTVGMRTVAGRWFTQTDDSTAHLVAIVNSRAAEDLWPGRDPLGQTLRIGPTGPPVDVVGVVNDSRVILIGESPRPVLYLPWAQMPSGFAHLTVKMSSVDRTAPSRLQDVIASVDPELAPHGIGWWDEIIRDSPNGLATIRLGATLGGAIGLLALILAVVGIYGVLSFSVTQETREIGVRLALGAAPSSIVRRILRQGGQLVGIGVAIGLAVALAGTRLLGGLLVGVKPTDLGVFAGAGLGLIAVALTAAFLPARRAARLDPVTALRSDA